MYGGRTKSLYFELGIDRWLRYECDLFKTKYNFLEVDYLAFETVFKSSVTLFLSKVKSTRNEAAVYTRTSTVFTQASAVIVSSIWRMSIMIREKLQFVMVEK